MFSNDRELGVVLVQESGRLLLYKGGRTGQVQNALHITLGSLVTGNQDHLLDLV